VKNIGNDGTGVHVSRTDVRFDTEIEDDHPNVLFENVELNTRILKRYKKVFDVSLRIRCKRFIKRLFKR